MASRSLGRLRLGVALVVATCSAPLVWVIADRGGEPLPAQAGATPPGETRRKPEAQDGKPIHPEGGRSAPPADPTDSDQPAPLHWVGQPPEQVLGAAEPAGQGPEPSSPPAYVGSLVWRGEQQPIAGAAVRLVHGDHALTAASSPFGTTRKAGWLTEPLHTNSLGQFVVPALGEATWTRPVFLVLFPDRPDARVHRLPHPATLGRTMQLDPIEFDRPGGVRGRFVTIGPQRGVPDVRVRVISEPTREAAATIATPGKNPRTRITPGLGVRRVANGGAVASGIGTAPRTLGLFDAPTAVTDSNGEFEFPRLRPGRSFLLAQSTSGIDWLVSWSVTPGRVTDVGTLRLPELQPVTLRLHEPEGPRALLASAQIALSPVKLHEANAGARVLDSVLSSSPLGCEADGTWRVPRPAIADQPVRLRRDPDAPWEVYDAVPDPPAADGLVHGYSLHLRRLAEVTVEVYGHGADGSGRLFDPDHLTLLPTDLGHDGAASQPIDPFGQKPDSAAWRLARIGLGRYRCAELPPGRYRILARSKGYGPRLFALTVASIPAGKNPRPIHFVVRLEQTFEIGVMVRNHAGTPVIGATVRAELLPLSPRPANSDWDSSRGNGARRLSIQGSQVVLGRTGADGTLRRSGWLTDRVRLTATHPEHGRGLAVVAGRRFGTIQVRLRHEGSLRGRVRFGSAPPAETYRVEARPLDALDATPPVRAARQRRDAMVWSATTDASGQFALTGIPVGGYALTARRAADGPAENTADLRLDAAASVATDRPVEVWLRRNQTQFVDIDLAAHVRAYHHAELTGNVTLDGRIERGLQVVVALATTKGSSERFYRRLIAAQRSGNKRRLKALRAELTRLVHATRNRSGSDRSQGLESYAEIFRASTVPDRYGNFTIRLPQQPGKSLRLTLVVLRPENGDGLELARVTFDQPPAGPIGLDLRTGSLNLLVRRANGLAAGRQRLRFSVGSTTFERTTDDHGQVRLQRVPAGSYRVQLPVAPRAEAPGGSPELATAEHGGFVIAPGSNSVQTIRLRE